MAHTVSTDVFTPGFESRPVKSEVNTSIHEYTLEDINFILHLLAYNNTRYSTTSRQLQEDYGLNIHPITLRKWVRSHFTQRYVQIQHDLEQQLNDKLSARTLDLASKAAEAQDMALERGMSDMSRLQPHQAAQAVKNYADAAQKNVQQAQLLQDKPTSINKELTPDTALETLRKFGLVHESDGAEEVKE